MYFFTSISLVLFLFESPVLAGNPSLFCSTNKTVQITSDDVLSSGVQHGSTLFLNLISASIDLDGHFYSSSVPNEGYFIFNDNYVITGFTTQGKKIAGSPRYVSEFSIEIVSNNSNYDNYTKIYSVDSFDEFYFSLDPLTPTHEIHFNVLSSILSSENYYWKIGLFGCKEADKFVLSQSTTKQSSNNISLKSSSLIATDSSSDHSSRSLSSLGYDSSYVITSVTMRHTSAQTSGGCSSCTCISSTQSSSSYNGIGILVVVIVLLVLLIVILITIIIIIRSLILCKRKITWSSGIKSIPLQEINDTNVTLQRPSESSTDNGDRESQMRENVHLYESVKESELTEHQDISSSTDQLLCTTDLSNTSRISNTDMVLASIDVETNLNLPYDVIEHLLTLKEKKYVYKKK